MDFTVQILGSNSALPASGRYPTSQVVTYGNQRFLIDCGEATQVRMGDFKVKRSKIDHIFISHLHGDHIFGLPGLITSFGHYSRKAPLNIYGPQGIEEFVVTTMRLSQSRKLFDINVHELETEASLTVYQNDHIHVDTIPLDHRIPTVGYLFKEISDSINIDPKSIARYGLSIDDIKEVKKGMDIVKSGVVIKNEQLIAERKVARAYAYCSDTAYSEKIIPQIKNVSTLYHEATYLNDMQEEARMRKHSTIGEAATIAVKADVGQLIVGHFSSRYKSLKPFIDQASVVFGNTQLAIEGEVFSV